MQTRTTNNTTRQIADFLKSLDRAAATTYTGADADTIGNAAALVRLVRSLGVEAVLCHSEDVPNYLRWLLPNEPLRECPPGHDLLVVGTSRFDRIGAAHEGVHQVGLDVDYHEANPLYRRLNLVDASAAASAHLRGLHHLPAQDPVPPAAWRTATAMDRLETGER